MEVTPTHPRKTPEGRVDRKFYYASELYRWARVRGLNSLQAKELWESAVGKRSTREMSWTEMLTCGARVKALPVLPEHLRAPGESKRDWFVRHGLTPPVRKKKKRMGPTLAYTTAKGTA